MSRPDDDASPTRVPGPGDGERAGAAPRAAAGAPTARSAAGRAAAGLAGGAAAGAPDDGPRLPVGTSPVFSGPGPASGSRAGAGATSAGRASSGEVEQLGGSIEYVEETGRPAPLGHDDYHAVVRARIADLERIDPERLLAPGRRLLVALDVDGTILTMDGRVTERVMASIARLRSYGAQVVIATGRGIQAALPVARHVGLTDGWMICANGALTLRMDPDAPGGYEVVESLEFDPAPAIDALVEAVPGAIVAVEDLAHGFRATELFPEGELIEDQTVEPLDSLRATPVTRVILRAPGMPVDEFSRKVAAAGLHSVEYAIGWSAWLDVAPDGVTKATALDALARRCGTGREHAIAVGDGTNDVEMIRWAGAGAVMGSAPQSVKDEGDLTTTSVWEDGCAAVLDALVERTRK